MDSTILGFDTSDEAREQNEIDRDAWVDRNSDRAYEPQQSAPIYDF